MSGVGFVGAKDRRISAGIGGSGELKIPENAGSNKNQSKKLSFNY